MIVLRGLDWYKINVDPSTIELLEIDGTTGQTLASTTFGLPTTGSSSLYRLWSKPHRAADGSYQALVRDYDVQQDSETIFVGRFEAGQTHVRNRILAEVGKANLVDTVQTSDGVDYLFQEAVSQGHTWRQHVGADSIPGALRDLGELSHGRPAFGGADVLVSTYVDPYITLQRVAPDGTSAGNAYPSPSSHYLLPTVLPQGCGVPLQVFVGHDADYTKWLVGLESP